LIKQSHGRGDEHHNLQIDLADADPMAQGSSWIDIDRVAATVGVTQVVEVGETIGLAETAAALIGYAGRAQLIRLTAINPGVIRVSRCFIAAGCV
jgi:hypothetical protein